MWRLSLGISHTLVLIEQNKILYKILKVFQWVVHCKLWSFRRHKQIKKILWNLVKPRWKCKQMTVLLDFYHVFFNGMEQSHNFFNRRGSSTMEIFFWNGDVRGKIPGIFFLNTVEIMIILITWTSFLYSQCFSVYREKWIFSLNFLSRSNNVMETFMMVIFFQMTSCNILSGYFIRVKLFKTCMSARWL